MSFSKDFIWGAATSAYQIEGASGADGKGESIWDYYCHSGKCYNFHTGDIACDHYNRYKEDVKIMAQIGLKAYRFSTAWTRILPDGTGKVNEKGLDFYKRLIDELKKYDIEPYLTMYHWDLPIKLHEKGGWLNPESSDWFYEYADVLTKKLGDRVNNILTINEPQCVVANGYAADMHAPGYCLTLAEQFKIAHNVLLAHGKAVSATRANCKAKVGIAPTGSMHFPLTETAEDIEAAKKALFGIHLDGAGTMFNVSLYSDPLFFGRYPDEAFEKFKCNPVKSGDMEIISQPIDLYCYNIYNGKAVKSDGRGGFEFARPKVGQPRTAMNWPVTPECLYWGPKFLYERYGSPILISENGLSCADTVSLDGKVHDYNRIDFLHRYLICLKRAVKEGVPVRGYFLWSLLDNFEWKEGYNERFGIVHVDFETQKRTIKDSAYWYKDVITGNGETL